VIEGETKSFVRFCPHCGSAAVKQDTLILSLHEPSVSTFDCEACSWRGPQEELVAVELTHQLGSDANLVDALASDLRRTLAREAGKPFLEFLLKWGFMAAPDPTVLARYLTAIAKATLESILKERLEIEKERISESSGRN
jgi:predicted RNA-binding Zn-ribbon protein involved in translation (DUF1610 family)